MSVSASEIEAIRKFNRFYTHQIGLLRHALYDSPFPLTEIRVLYELAHRDHPTSTEIFKDLNLDPGYLSRILRKFEKEGLLQKSVSQKDGRQTLLSLTQKGHGVFAPIDASSSHQVSVMLERLSAARRKRLIDAMDSIQQLLGNSATAKTPYLLRQHQPGDIGWIVQHHGTLYWREYGYDERFEALVAEIAAKFIQNLDHKRERCWMAEKDGEIVGCVLLVKESKTVARLRVLLVEPAARGLGIGKRLVEECIRFARNAGYKKITLWTQSELHSARRIYESTGFRLIRKEKHDSWGKKNLVAETWELKL